MTRETHTIQTWPSGQGFDYRGDPNGPADQRQLRTRHKQLDPSDWGAPECLLWLAEHTQEPNHYASRAHDWAGEVKRFAEYEEVDPGEWEQDAVQDLQRGVVERMEALSWRDGEQAEWRQILHSRQAERYSDVEIYYCDSSLVDDLIKATGCGELANRNLVAESAGSTLAEGFSYDEIRVNVGTLRRCVSKYEITPSLRKSTNGGACPPGSAGNSMGLGKSQSTTITAIGGDAPAPAKAI